MLRAAVHDENGLQKRHMASVASYQIYVTMKNPYRLARAEKLTRAR